MHANRKLGIILATVTAIAGMLLFVASPVLAQAVTWTSQFGTTGSDAATGVAVDSAGNIYVTGYVAGALPGQTAAGGTDVFVRKYDSNKNIVWTAQFGSIKDDSAKSIALDSVGNVYVAGYTSGILPGQTSAGSSDAFVAKLSSAGFLVWTRQFGSTGGDLGEGVAVDGSSNVYVT
ncbi:MAG: SBBP repeat-containing protein, partial [Chloroflexota bacterium]